MRQAFGELAYLVIQRRVIDREKDFGDPALRLARVFLDALEGPVDLLVGNIGGLRGLPPHQLCPDDPGAQLIDQRPAIEATRLQELVQLPVLHIVLFFDLLQRGSDLAIGRGDVLLLGFLQLQLFVDQPPQDLRAEPLPCFRAVGNV